MRTIKYLDQKVYQQLYNITKIVFKRQFIVPSERKMGYKFTKYLNYKLILKLHEMESTLRKQKTENHNIEAKISKIKKTKVMFITYKNQFFENTNKWGNLLKR